MILCNCMSDSNLRISFLAQTVLISGYTGRRWNTVSIQAMTSALKLF